jgi:regulator of RNase E activity RraA
MRLLGSSMLSDAKGGKDVIDCQMCSRINEGHIIAGVAETVHILQKSLDPIRSIFDKLAKSQSKNTILVIDASGLHGAVWGDMFTRFAKKASILGCIIDGGIRDVSEIKKLDFPIWARYITPQVITGEWATTYAPGFELAHPSSIPILCGGVLVRPGDYISADLDGIIVIRPEEVEETLEKAENIRLMEEKMIAGNLR